MDILTQPTKCLERLGALITQYEIFKAHHPRIVSGLFYFMSLILKELLTFYDIDSDGDVEIEMSTGDGNCRVYINRLEIQEAIKFLQEQLDKK